jgi:hypothetical protein
LDLECNYSSCQYVPEALETEVGRKTKLERERKSRYREKGKQRANELLLKLYWRRSIRLRKKEAQYLDSEVHFEHSQVIRCDIKWNLSRDLWIYRSRL